MINFSFLLASLFLYTAPVLAGQGEREGRLKDQSMIARCAAHFLASTSEETVDPSRVTGVLDQTFATPGRLDYDLHYDSKQAQWTEVLPWLGSMFERSQLDTTPRVRRRLGRLRYDLRHPAGRTEVHYLAGTKNIQAFLGKVDRVTEEVDRGLRAQLPPPPSRLERVVQMAFALPGLIGAGLIMTNPSWEALAMWAVGLAGIVITDVVFSRLGQKRRREGYRASPSTNPAHLDSFRASFEKITSAFADEVTRGPDAKAVYLGVTEYVPAAFARELHAAVTPADLSEEAWAKLHWVRERDHRRPLVDDDGERLSLDYLFLPDAGNGQPALIVVTRLASGAGDLELDDDDEDDFGGRGRRVRTPSPRLVTSPGLLPAAG